eukprot:TRINITY_DN62223_c0_g1_i1.p2 TRINITY_DN62223_c0_g1~~TRINITY_DN62223_c0_g1_i1.p2  ORF type:complete len:101 (-),score=16.03 TRINITY_DN62223_c0_g1_i1:61-363(-)
MHPTQPVQQNPEDLAPRVVNRRLWLARARADMQHDASVEAETHIAQKYRARNNMDFSDSGSSGGDSELDAVDEQFDGSQELLPEDEFLEPVAADPRLFGL